jgi:hypothetical protein
LLQSLKYLTSLNFSGLGLDGEKRDLPLIKKEVPVIAGKGVKKGAFNTPGSGRGGKI